MSLRNQAGEGSRSQKRAESGRVKDSKGNIGGVKVKV